MDELRDWLALHRIFWQRPKAAWEAVLKVGSVGRLLHRPRGDLCTVLDTDWTAIEQLRRTVNWRQADLDMAVFQKMGITVTLRGSSVYPELLTHIPDPPLMLFWRGQIPQQGRETVAVVGSRKATCYGRDVVDSFTAELVAAEVTIVSGLAYGIDAHAHRATLAARGTTIAVLASGIDDITPHGHQKLGELVMENGALCSEFPLGTPAFAAHFLFRNRIISGLATATVVVEAEVRSGSLVTARHAADQGRSVFAVPGPVTSPLSAGCNQLIKEGAYPCTCAADILNGGDPTRCSAHSPTPCNRVENEKSGHPKVLDDTTTKILETLSTGPCTANQLGDRLQMPIAQILQRITALECAGILKVLPGGVVARN